MTIQKQLSHLSFAAIMLVFAALPALAQTGSVESSTAVATTSTSVAAAEVAALRKERSIVPAKESTIVVAPANTEKQPSFSLNQFVNFAAEPAMISDSKVLEFTSLDKPGKAFNDTAAKSIYFVPSPGPKLPWQQ